MDIPADKPAVAKQERLVSLDALRGFDMLWIIGGGGILGGLAKGLNSPWFDQVIVPHTRHVPWEGFVAWDLIMPLFLFVVGAAMPFSFAKRLGQGQSKTRIWTRSSIKPAIFPCRVTHDSFSSDRVKSDSLS